jgi:type I restriction enzyme R subunit
MKFNENATVEQYVIRFMRDKLGYVFIKPEAYSQLRQQENEVLVEEHLKDALRKINGVDDETVLATIVREVKKADTNQEFLNLLRYGVELKNSETGKTSKYRLLDFTDPDNNNFVVTNQFYFAGDAENIRPDIMLFVNGIPIVDIEAKSPTASATTDYSEAIGQIKRYERVAPKLFVPNLFSIATDGLQTVYGATYSPEQYFLKWRDDELLTKYGGDPKNKDSSEGQLEVTLDSLLRPENLLDIIANFIVYEQTPDGVIKKVARYQQVRATNKIVERVKKDEFQKGLVWHTQGSGKTLTMFFTAWKLRYDPDLDSPKIFVLIDRVDLDDQVYDEFVNHGGKNIVRVTSRKQLEEVIASPERGIFISTIQKFSELGTEIENLDKNVIVLSDEAHRSEEGVAGINLRYALKHAFFFGFTGTPIDKKTLNTHRNYGPDGERYLDYYSIQQAIDDGATLPVTYEARLSKFAVDEARVDKQFNEMTPDLSDEQRQELVRKYGTKSALIMLPARMQAVIQDIVEHYKLYVLPNGFKGQIVCYNREATATYKRMLDELVPAEWSAVVYSSGNANTDSEDLREHNTSKRERDEIIRNFKNPHHPLKLVLVCDMLLTGFDAPIEQVMYLDKPLRDHTLLQAVARTNRLYPNKEAGKIIDYYGMTRNLYDSLDFDEEIVNEAMINIDQMRERYAHVNSELLMLFEGVNQEDPSAENLRFVLRRFIDNEDKQLYFINKYNRLKSLFEFLAPDPFLKEYIQPFEWFTSVYLAFMKEFKSEDDSHLLKGFGEKVKKLVNENVEYEGITKNFRVLKLEDIYTMQRLDGMDEKEQALQLEKLLKSEISEHVETNPHFQKFSERLRTIRDQFEQGQLDLSERIKQYRDLLDNVKSAHDEAKASGMELRTYSLYLLVKDFAPDSEDNVVREYATELTSTLDDKVLDKNWQNSSKYDLFVKNIKRTILELTLKEYKDRLKIDDFSKFQNRITDAVIKTFK